MPEIAFPAIDLLDPLAFDVQTDHWETSLSEGDGERKPNVSQAHHPDARLFALDQLKQRPRRLPSLQPSLRSIAHRLHLSPDVLSIEEKEHCERDWQLTLLTVN